MKVVCFHQAKSLLERDSRIQDVAHERILKKRRVAFRDEDDMRLGRDEIASLKQPCQRW